MKAAIMGAGGHAKVVADIAETIGYDIAFFVSDDKSEHCGKSVVSQECFIQSGIDTVFLGIGDNAARQRVFLQMKSLNLKLPSLVHPSAIVSKSAVLGYGTVVMPNAVINAYARVGAAVIINTAAVIEHDTILGDFVHVSPNAALAGGVNVGNGSWVGIGVCVIQQIRIGKNCIIGAGGVVISDISDGCTAVGVPAKIKERIK